MALPLILEHGVSLHDNAALNQKKGGSVVHGKTVELGNSDCELVLSTYIASDS